MNVSPTNAFGPENYASKSNVSGLDFLGKLLADATATLETAPKATAMNNTSPTLTFTAIALISCSPFSLFRFREIAHRARIPALSDARCRGRRSHGRGP